MAGEGSEDRGKKKLRPMFNFEKLDVWHKAIDFADFIYSGTRDFPIEERFGLTNQMRRAAVFDLFEYCRRLFANVANGLCTLYRDRHWFGF